MQQSLAPVIPINREAAPAPLCRHAARVLKETGATAREVRAMLAGLEEQGFGLSPVSAAAVLREFAAVA